VHATIITDLGMISLSLDHSLALTFGMILLKVTTAMVEKRKQR